MDKRKWVDELARVLWAYKTTTQLTKVTLFALAYDKVTVIPTKIGIPTIRTIVQERGMNGSPNGLLPSESNDSV